MIMIDDELDQLLKNLHLKRLPKTLSDDLTWATDTQPSYQAFLTRILRQEYFDRQDRSLEARIKRAQLPERWCLETFPFDRQPGVSRAVIAQLAELQFVVEAHNVVFVGPTGVGKTGLACSLVLKAIYNGYRCLFVKAQELFDEMYASLADRSSRKLLNRLVNMDILLIDEMGYLNLRPEQANIFFKLMDERYGRKSTILTTNLVYDDWYDFLGKKQMVGALLDRLRHHCHTISIDGPSLRTPVG